MCGRADAEAETHPLELELVCGERHEVEDGARKALARARQRVRLLERHDDLQSYDFTHVITSSLITNAIINIFTRREFEWRTTGIFYAFAAEQN